jgi:tetratricopeptide (TPR) repeat protein
MRQFANIIRLTLLAVLLITPWVFGGVWARVQWILMLVLALLLAADLVGRFGDEDRPNLVPTAWLPVLAGLLLGLFQLIPWPPAVVDMMAPTTARWRTELVGDSEPAGRTESSASAVEVTGGKWVRRSVYPAATRQYLALLTLALAVFVLASIHLVDRQTVRWFLASVAICGAALSFFGLIQRLSWNGKFYWVFEPLEGSFQSFGPFVNRNNAGGFLNLCLAAGLGLLVWLHWDPSAGYRSGSSRDSRRSRLGERRRSGSSRPGDSARREVERSPARRDDAPSVRDPAATTPDSDASSAERPAAELARTHRNRDRRSASRSDRRRTDGPHADYASASYPLSYRSPSRRSARLPIRRLREIADHYLADLNAKRLGGLALVVFMVGGVLCTASRGSILALCAATTITAVTLLLRRGSRGYAAGLLTMMVAGAALMSWAGQTEFVRSRFALTFEQSPYDQGRLPNWFDALQVVPQFPVAGSGLGTYAYVYERYQQRFLPGTVHRHAENQFIQAVVEGGFVALSLLLVVIALTGAAIVRLFRAGGPVNMALGVAGTYGLVSQLIGGLFDFGLYIPSNTLLMAALCGIVIGRAALLSVWPPEAFDSLDRPSSRHPYVTGTPNYLPSIAHRPLTDDRLILAGVTRSRSDSSAIRSSRSASRSAALGLTAPAMLVTLLIGVLMVGCLFASLEINRAARIEVAVRQADLPYLLERNLPDDLMRAAVPLQTILPQRWDDAEAHQHLALLLLAQYQSETYHRLVAQQAIEQAQAGDFAGLESGTERSAAELPEGETGETSAPLDPELWSRASLQHLHRTLRQLQQAGKHAEADQLVASQRVKQLLVPAMRHFVTARLHAPTISRVHYRLAELSAISPSLGDEQRHLQRAQLLSPGDATLWYWSGVLHLNSGRVEETCQNWRRSLLLSRLHLDDVMTTSQGALTVRQLLDQTLPNQADLLLDVARKYFAGDERAQLRHVFLARAGAALDETPLPRAENEYTRAAILNLQGRQDEAVPLYEHAISLDSNNRTWRFEYARLLIDLERFDDALQHVNFLIQAEPRSGPYRQLQKEFHAKRWRAGTPTEP